MADVDKKKLAERSVFWTKSVYVSISKRVETVPRTRRMSILIQSSANMCAH